MRIARLAVSLTCPLTLIASRFGWGRHWWIAVPCLAMGVGAITLGLYDRQSAGTDDPATLGLRG